MTDYTRKEAAAISAAWQSLRYLAETMDCSAPVRLDEALRYEAKHRSSRTVAMALIVREAADGWSAMRLGGAAHPLLRPFDMWRLSTGLAVAHMFGSEMASKYDASSMHADQVGAGRYRDRCRDFVAVAGAAISAHDAAQTRRSEELHP